MQYFPHRPKGPQYSEIMTALVKIQATLKSLVEATSTKSEGAAVVKREDDPNYIVSTQCIACLN